MRIEDLRISLFGHNYNKKVRIEDLRISLFSHNYNKKVRIEDLRIFKGSVFTEFSFKFMQVLKPSFEDFIASFGSF